MANILEQARETAARLARTESDGEAAVAAEPWRAWLAECPLASLLAEAGFRIEGPGDPTDDGLVGRYWWTLMRVGWSGIECGDDFESSLQARGDAVRALLSDEDLDWERGRVREHAIRAFPANFDQRMASMR